MRWETRQVDSWQEFVRWTFDLPFRTHEIPWNPYVFRGHGNESWKLEASIDRDCAALVDNLSEMLAVETRLLFEFKQVAFQHSQGLVQFDGALEWLILMQHHGAPTRLLDWSASPFVALYFACVEQGDADGAVWMFSQEQFVVQAIHDFPGKRWIEYSQKSCDFSVSDEHTRLPVDLFVPKRQTDRMLAQQSIFTIARNRSTDHEQLISDVLPHGFSDQPNVLRLIIPKNLKQEFLRRLSILNVNARTLFPGLDGVGASLKQFARLYSPQVYGAFVFEHIKDKDPPLHSSDS